MTSAPTIAMIVPGPKSRAFVLQPQSALPKDFFLKKMVCLSHVQSLPQIQKGAANQQKLAARRRTKAMRGRIGRSNPRNYEGLANNRNLNDGNLKVESLNADHRCQNRDGMDDHRLMAYHRGG